MTWKKINTVVSYWSKPSLTSKRSKMMALSVDKSTLQNKIKYGIAREVYKRTGKVNIKGFVDQSKLITVKSNDLLTWKKEKNLEIKNIDKIIKKQKRIFMKFIGLEDPDIYNKDNLKHLFFTIAYRDKKRKKFDVFLGHAQGKTLETLKATKPVLSPKRWIKGKMPGFKEISIIPQTNMALVEVGSGTEGTRIARARFKSLNKKFKSKKIVLDPKKLKHNWCNGELSPGPIIKYKDLCIGFLNGRNKAKKLKGKTIYGKYKVGIMLINSKNGKINWVSPTPLIIDPKAKSVTFISDIIQLNNNKLLAYAHIDDSFVRAYKINLKELKKLLP